MNKKGASPQLTWFAISLLAFVAIIGMAVVGMNEFHSTPGNEIVYVNDTVGYSSVYENITSKSGAIQTIGEPGLSSITDIAFTGIGTILTTAVMGIQAIVGFIAIIPIAKDIINMLSLGPLSDGMTLLIGFLVAAVGIYLTAKIIQGVRGTNQEP